MHSTFLEQKHYSSPLDCLEIKRRKTVAFIPAQDSFEILPKLVWEERFDKKHHQYILEVKPNFTPPLELPFYVACNSLPYHMAFYNSNIICQQKVHRAFSCIGWCLLPQSNPTAEGSKEQKALDKS